MSRPGRFVYAFPRPAVTVDVLVTRPGADGIEGLFILRANEPFAGRWAIPGGFVDPHEDLEAAGRRELREEAGLEVGRLVEIGMFGRPGRDPRGHTVTAAYLGAVRRRARLTGFGAGDDASDARFFPLRALPPLAFDHDDIVSRALGVLRREALDGSILFEWLPREFALDEFARLASEAAGIPVRSGLLRRLAHLPWFAKGRTAGRWRFDAASFRAASPEVRHGWLLG